MLTHDAQRTKDDGRQPIEIGHLSDSGDLKTTLNTMLDSHEDQVTKIFPGAFGMTIYIFNIFFIARTMHI